MRLVYGCIKKFVLNNMFYVSDIMLCAADIPGLRGDNDEHVDYFDIAYSVGLVVRSPILLSLLRSCKLGYTEAYCR